MFLLIIKAFAFVVFLVLLLSAHELGYSLTWWYVALSFVLSFPLGFLLTLAVGHVGTYFDDRARAKRIAKAKARKSISG